MEMNINNYREEEQSLPQLIKQSTTYKLFVPRKVEEKIRYLIRKFPHTEWSGVLFYTHTGHFETNDLEIHCEDLYPMDLGTSGWTEFKMTEDVTAYIAENLELFNCEQGLIHSHHTLGAWFSRQDIYTLRTEGNDTNCFVSLIVDTKGTYQAAITRKMQQKKLLTSQNLGSSYEFFGEGPKAVSEAEVQTSNEVTETCIEYFMLDVQREEADNPYSFLDRRFDEIESNKKKAVISTATITKNNTGSAWLPKPKEKVLTDFKETVQPDEGFFDWLHRKDEKTKQPALFSDKEMVEMTDISKWKPNPDIIHYLVCQLVTCSLIINKDIDLKQWINRHMNKKYAEIFGDDITSLHTWNEFIVEFLVNKYMEPDMSEELFDDPDWLSSKVAACMYNELHNYSDNKFIQEYMEILSRYIYE